jgi:hypothetical protein
MPINKIITSLSIFFEEDKITNTNYKNRYQELRNLVFYCCDIWNNVVYAWDRISVEKNNFDPRFYYQSIIFNLYMLGAITSSIGSDALNNDRSLKDLRDNIAHMDERLKKPLNIIPMNEIEQGSVFNNDNGGKIFTKSLCGSSICLDDNVSTSSPLGIIGNTVFSSLAPSERSEYTKFVSYEVTENKLITIQSKLVILLEKYFKNIKFDVVQE